MRRTTAHAAALIVSVVYAAGILRAGGTLEADWLRWYSIAVIALVVGFWLWDTYLWRIRPIQTVKGFRVPRDIRGTWKGTLVSFWEDPETGKSPLPKTVYLVVRQTASHVSVVLLTDESKSVSSLSTVTEDGISSSLAYMYLNKPQSRLAHRSRIHHGSTVLNISGQPASRLHGHYWTDRDTRGELDFDEVRRPLADDFASAKELFSAAKSRPIER